MAYQRHVAVIGGGIAGLAAAYRLRRTRPEVHVTVFERDRRLGGKILTERIGGFLIEGGPDSFLASKPAGIGLCRAVGIERELVPPIAENRQTFVVRDGQLVEIPEGLSGLIPARLEAVRASPLFSPAARRRFEQEGELPPGEGTGDESLAAFVSRRFGREVYERLVEPLMGGIYAGDGEELSLAATFPQLRALERSHGSVLRGLRETAGTDDQPPRPGFLAPLGGMGRLVSALQVALTEIDLALETPVRRVKQTARGYAVEPDDGTQVAVDGVVLAVPAHAAAPLLARIAPDGAAALGEIPHVSTATVSLGYSREAVPHDLAGFGYIVPRAEGGPVLACTWVSSKFPQRAPAGHVLLRGFVGRRAHEMPAGVSDEDLIALVREEVRTRLGITARPQIARAVRWALGMPQYTLGHMQRLARIKAALADCPGLQVAGQAYAGVGIPDCIASGEAAADEVAGTHI